MNGESLTVQTMNKPVVNLDISAQNVMVFGIVLILNGKTITSMINF
jgi:heme O synthase-like polyprenyltransferase